MMATVRWFFTLAVVLVLAVAPVLAAEPGSGTMAEIDQMLKSYSQAFSNKNAEAVMGFYAPEALLMGTGPGERYEGSAEIRDAYLHFFESYDKQTSERTWHKVWVKGDVAWGISMEQFTTYFKNVKNEFAINTSVVLEKRNGKWVIVSHHFSNLVQ
jgi:uncharacterized protein (TIGR02246 family)